MVDALPLLHQLRQNLQLVVDDTPPQELDEGLDDESDASSEEFEKPTPPVIRIAAKAATLVIDKYLDKLLACDIYTIAIGIFLFILCLSILISCLAMCPDRKLQWFKAYDSKVDAKALKVYKSKIVKFWMDNYAPEVERKLLLKRLRNPSLW